MPYPFPGMNPWLERPGLWGSIHARLIVALADDLNPRLRPRAELYPFNVREPVPLFQMPLRADDDEPVIDLGALLREMYERANYDLTIDYGVEPEPPLLEADAAWARELVKANAL